MNVVCAGRVVYFRAPHHPHPHVYLVLTEPDNGKVVWVMIRTKKEYTDKTVVLDKGDHPFVQRETSVDYGLATFRPVTKIETAITTGTCKLLADLSPTMLQRIQDGLLASPRTPNALKNYCRPIFG